MMHTLATGTEVAYLVIAIGAAIAAYLLMPRPENDFKADTDSQTLAERGSFCQYVIGRRPVKPYYIWVGDRRTIAARGGGKGGPSSSPGGNNYVESAGQLIALGPVDRLLSIKQEGKVIWSGNLNRFSTPSGTRITIPNEGSLEIYWGEKTQPICEYLAATGRIGIRSAYPYHCYFVWVDKKLGSSARWPDLEYEIEASTFGSQMLSSSRTFNDRPGVNAAHVYYQLATAQWPHGCGLDVADLDFGKLEEVGIACQDEGIALSILIKDGDTTEEIIGSVMLDAGFTTPQIGSRIVPILIREPDSYPEFDSRHLTDPEPEVEVIHGDEGIDRVVYLFDDYTADYSATSVSADDDAESDNHYGRNPSTVDMTNVIDGASAAVVADRREAESFMQGSLFDLPMTSSARALHAGMPFKVAGYGRLRCNSIVRNTESAGVNVKATLDAYGIYSGLGRIEVGDNGVVLTPEPDLEVALFEAPYLMAPGDQPQIGVVRLRANVSVGGAVITFSGDGTTYTTLGSQVKWACGGELLTDILRDTGEFIESVTFRPANSDTNLLLDLSTDDSGWAGGRQLALVHGELFLVRSATANDDGTWTLNSLIRQAYGTVAREHLSGSRIYIFERSSINLLSDVSIIPGRTIYVKCQPVGVSSESIVAQTITLTGRASAPLPPCSFRGEDLASGYNGYGNKTGGRLYTEGYNYRIFVSPRVRDGDGRAAGEQVSGALVSASGVPQTWWEGDLRVTIYTEAGVQVRTWTTSTRQYNHPIPVVGDETYYPVTYTASDMNSDFAGYPDRFVVGLAFVLGDRVSEETLFNVEKEF